MLRSLAGNNTFGYLFAMDHNSGTVYTTVDKMTYSTETTCYAVSTALGSYRIWQRYLWEMMVLVTSWVVLYLLLEPGPTTIQKITYSSDTRLVIPSTITDVGFPNSWSKLTKKTLVTLWVEELDRVSSQAQTNFH